MIKYNYDSNFSTSYLKILNEICDTNYELNIYYNKHESDS